VTSDDGRRAYMLKSRQKCPPCDDIIYGHPASTYLVLNMLDALSNLNFYLLPSKLKIGMQVIPVESSHQLCLFYLFLFPSKANMIETDGQDLLGRPHNKCYLKTIK